MTMIYVSPSLKTIGFNNVWGVKDDAFLIDYKNKSLQAFFAQNVSYSIRNIAEILFFYSNLGGTKQIHSNPGCERG